MKFKKALLTILPSLFLFGCVSNEQIPASSSISSQAVNYEINLSVKSIKLDVGEYFQILAVTESNNVTWSSNNENVATVEGGVVRAIAKGTTSIKASTEDDYAICNVTVNDNGLSKDVVIEIPSGDELELFAGDAYQLNPFLKKGKERVEDAKFSYSVSRKSIATIDDDGVISAKAKGLTVISIISEYEGKTYQKTIDLRVKEPSLSITPDYISYDIYRDKAVDLSVSVYLGSQRIDDYAVTFSSSNTNVAKVSGKTLKTLMPGFTTITYKLAYDGEIYSGSNEIKVLGKIHLSLLSIEDEAIEMEEEYGKVLDVPSRDGAVFNGWAYEDGSPYPGYVEKDGSIVANWLALNDGESPAKTIDNLGSSLTKSCSGGNQEPYGLQFTDNIALGFPTYNYQLYKNVKTLIYFGHTIDEGASYSFKYGAYTFPTYESSWFYIEINSDLSGSYLSIYGANYSGGESVKIDDLAANGKISLTLQIAFSFDASLGKIKDGWNWLKFGQGETPIDAFYVNEREKTDYVGNLLNAKTTDSEENKKLVVKEFDLFATKYEKSKHKSKRDEIASSL